MARAVLFSHAACVVAVSLLALAAVASLWVFASPAVAGGACRGEPVTSRDTTAVSIGEMPCFTPTTVSVGAGDTVTWTNEGSLPHTVTGANASWGDYTEFEKGDSVSHQFDSAGTYAYYCLLHPGMVGAVIVMNDGGSGRAESASLIVSSGSSGPPDSAASESSSSNRSPLSLAAAVAALLVAGSFGFVLGQRRRSG